MLPSAYDKVAVAVLMAARVTYSANRQWLRERGNRQTVPEWADAAPDTQSQWVGTVLHVISHPALTAEDMHNIGVTNQRQNGVDPSALVPFAELNVADRVQDELTVSIVRAVTLNLVSAEDVAAYLDRLGAGTDEFMREG